MKILSAEQMYEADKITVKNQGITTTELMERAGTQVFEWLQRHMEPRKETIHIFCGIGNNGGDGLVVGRLLLQAGYKVRVYIVNYSDKRSKDFMINLKRLKRVSDDELLIIEGEPDFPDIQENEIIVDAIFGMGLNRPPEGWVKSLIKYLARLKAFKLAIDIPSGLYANSPIHDREAIFNADRTLSFQFPKLAFFLPESGPFVSDFDILDIGLDANFMKRATPLATLVTQETVHHLYRPRGKFGHKGTYGHTVVIGGSYGKIGAAVIASSAAFKAGAGMVTAVVPQCGYQILQTTLPEAMVITDSHNSFLTEINLDFNPASIAIGMGMGQSEASVQGLENFFTTVKAPVVIDADGLNHISKNRNLLESIPENAILTPHPGELKRLIGEWSDDYDKIEKAKRFSKNHKVVLLIKGAYTMTIYKDSVYINTTGNPGMGTAGSGDALSGVIAGLLSQQYKPLDAALFGVYLHGKAGDMAADRLGPEAVMAHDIIENLSEAYKNLI